MYTVRDGKKVIIILQLRSTNFIFSSQASCLLVYRLPRARHLIRMATMPEDDALIYESFAAPGPIRPISQDFRDVFLVILQYPDIYNDSYLVFKNKVLVYRSLGAPGRIPRYRLEVSFKNFSKIRLHYRCAK